MRWEDKVLMERRFRPYLSRWEKILRLRVTIERVIFYCLFVRYKKCSASHDHDGWVWPRRCFGDCEELQQISDAFRKCSQLRKLWIGVDGGDTSTEIMEPNEDSRLVVVIFSFSKNLYKKRNLKKSFFFASSLSSQWKPSNWCKKVMYQITFFVAKQNTQKNVVLYFSLCNWRCLTHRALDGSCFNCESTFFVATEFKLNRDTDCMQMNPDGEQSTFVCSTGWCLTRLESNDLITFMDFSHAQPMLWQHSSGRMSNVFLSVTA